MTNWIATNYLARTYGEADGYESTIHEQSCFTAGFIHAVDSMTQEGNWDMIVANASEHYMVISSHPWSPTIRF